MRQGVPVTFYQSGTDGAIKVKTQPERLHPAILFKNFMIKAGGADDLLDCPVLAQSFIYRKASTNVNKIALCVGYHNDTNFFDYLKACSLTRFNDDQRPNLMQRFV